MTVCGALNTADGKLLFCDSRQFFADVALIEPGKLRIGKNVTVCGTGDDPIVSAIYSIAETMWPSPDGGLVKTIKSYVPDKDIDAAVLLLFVDGSCFLVDPTRTGISPCDLPMILGEGAATLLFMLLETGYNIQSLHVQEVIDILVGLLNRIGRHVITIAPPWNFVWVDGGVFRKVQKGITHETLVGIKDCLVQSCSCNSSCCRQQ